jgi:hypothetical protein
MQNAYAVLTFSCCPIPAAITTTAKFSWWTITKWIYNVESISLYIPHAAAFYHSVVLSRDHWRLLALRK